MLYSDYILQMKAMDMHVYSNKVTFTSPLMCQHMEIQHLWPINSIADHRERAHPNNLNVLEIKLSSDFSNTLRLMVRSDNGACVYVDFTCIDVNARH